ncbi:UDP-2-acetamido-2-deoxy-ribo-hexuluronate aminotransferase [Fibrobacter sp. UWH5]|uniref:DegT/DnrJ/EryC1/StrS family aminotransferase n=1 Tax=Fibrobacter sp. UWH5 TaxID=1896211 RepID=UPI0009184EB0|nr:DegT/DnrJ/EryC1/StrS family aminotransferase [Fibrobacter sp. UWH5]SHL76175.1 UDP-2-acetamido-2-deoxy-ribo-hexuluronate aminotransferase [Fibrobacter sp. UWH5]
MIPFVNLQKQRDFYKNEFLEAEKEVLDSGCFIGGPQVDNLEKELVDYIGLPDLQAISCGSGTDAITIALMALGLKPGDEVIVPDFTFIAPAECVALLGGTPRFADINNQTLQIDPESVRSLITDRTVGIIGVDLFGQCAPFEELRRISDKHGLWLLEDAAQAYGAKCGNQTACTLGDISITSFYPTKPLGCYGDGGAMFTRDSQLAEKMRMLANHGSKGHYHHEILGLNSRLDALQAAILRVKLRHLKDELEIRRNNACKYDELFHDSNISHKLGDPIPQTLSPGNESSVAQYTLLAQNREKFIEILKGIEVPYCIHYPAPLSEQKCFREILADKTGNGPVYTPNAHLASTQAISLPVCAFTDVDEIIGRIKNF